MELNCTGDSWNIETRGGQYSVSHLELHIDITYYFHYNKNFFLVFTLSANYLNVSVPQNTSSKLSLSISRQGIVPAQHPVLQKKTIQFQKLMTEFLRY